MKRTALFAALLAISAAAHAVDGEIVITHAKALAGNVTPGDAPGYPVTLSLPGKYKLGSNLVQPDPSTKVIEATAYTNNVDLDLNGFSVSGNNYCDDSTETVVCDQNEWTRTIELNDNSHVHNGMISNVSGYAVLLKSGTAENLIISGARFGIQYTSIKSQGGNVRNNSIRYISSWAITVHGSTVVSGNNLQSVNSGISTYGRTLITGNVLQAYGNPIYCSADTAYGNNVLKSRYSNPTSGTGCNDTGSNLSLPFGI